MTAYLCSGTVGLVFLVTGTIKALDARGFVRDVGEYGLLSRKWTLSAALALVGLECALGGALLVRLSDVLIPAAAAIVLVFFGVTLWAAAARRIEDCGCYGGLLHLSLRQSLLLDVGYLALLVTAWILADPGRPMGLVSSLSKVAVAAGAGAAGILLFRRSIEQGPLVDFGLLKTGKRWNPRWLKDSPRQIEQGSHMVVFLSEDCPYCKQWVPLLNVIEVQADMPRVIGLVAARGVDRDRFLAEHLIRFPIASIPRPLMRMMANAYPTAALVENGVIQQTFVGEFPPAYAGRIRQFYDSISTAKPAAPAFSG